MNLLNIEIVAAIQTESPNDVSETKELALKIIIGPDLIKINAKDSKWKCWYLNVEMPAHH